MPQAKIRKGISPVATGVQGAALDLCPSGPPDVGCAQPFENANQ